MDKFDSISSEYFSLPSLRDTEATSHDLELASNHNIQETSGIMREINELRCSNSENKTSFFDEIDDFQECNSVSELCVINGHIKMVQDDIISKSNNVDNGIQMDEDHNQDHHTLKVVKTERSLLELPQKGMNPGGSCQTDSQQNCFPKSGIKDNWPGNQCEGSPADVESAAQPSVSDHLDDSSTPNNRCKKAEMVTFQELRVRSSSETDATSAPASLMNHSSNPALDGARQRPTYLPLGSPPSYMEALRCSPLCSLPYDLNISQSRASLYTLNNSSFNGVFDYNSDSDPIHLEQAPRLVALPSVHSIHTIHRSAATTPCATPEDGILQETIVPATEGFDSHPCAAFCKACQITVLTTTSTRYRSTTYCCCFLMFFSGVCCPFSFLPFFLCGPKKVFHMCPQCKNVMAVYVDKD